jgi:hypothetical protein
MGRITHRKWKGLRRGIAGVTAAAVFFSGTVFRLPAGASNIWPQKSTAPFYCIDGGKPWRSSDRYEEMGREEAGVTDEQARRLFWAYPDIWNGVLKPAAAKYDPELYEEIRGTGSDPNVVKRVKDDSSTKFAWVADNPEIEERAKAAVVKYAAESAESGRTPPASLFNQETGTYAVYENAAVKISLGDFGPGSALGQDFGLDSYFVSQIKNVEPQTVYDNGSTGGAVGWIDASQDKNIATSVLGTKLYEITWSGSSLHIVNNGSQYANETILDPNVPDEVKFNKTIVRYKITMKENSGYVLEAAWNENYLDEWMRFKVCVTSSDRQRLYTAQAPIEPSSMPFYIEISQNGEPVEYPPVETEWSVPFQIYRHEETFEADYNVRLKKMDAETGMPIKGSQFYLYERFDDRGKIGDSQRDGSLAEENLSFSPWDGFRIFSDAVTDGDGTIVHTDHREYEYEKTYCNGHPAPKWAEIPETAADPVTGQVTNEADIQAAEDANRAAAAEWLRLVEACEAEMEDTDTHFHWMADESMYEKIAAAAESGETESFGEMDVTKETAFEKSGCQADCEETYENFINLEFSYTWKEIQAAVGYVLHGLHPEDVPVEIITTNSSQAGAESRFGNGYSRDIRENVWYGGNVDRASSFEDAAFRSLYAGEPEAMDMSWREKPAVMPQEEELELMREYSVNLMKLLLETERKTTDSDAASVGTKSTVSNAAVKKTATASNAATTSDAWAVSDGIPASGTGASARKITALQAGKAGISAMVSDDEWESGKEGTESFASYLESAGADGISHLESREEDRFSHCSGADDCGDSWRVYDHRTEGRIHINKRDLELYRKESEEYSSYGDTEGDATLEGAVYGLFAAEDILHPDSQVMEDGTVKNTGVVYRRGDLAAVAATDWEGNADFLVFTEAPGSSYDYEKGMIVQNGGWPGNLYQSEGFQAERDGYSPDGTGGLTYQDNEALNGNPWIGRPLLLGKYYVKELSRSEGFELSVNGITRADTNRGTGFETPDSILSSNGTAVLSLPELSASMEGEDGSGNGYDQLPFTVTSSGTEGYDLLISGFPKGTRFYREDSGEEMVTGPHIIGFEETIVRDGNGEIVWKRAESDESDLRYEPVYDSTGAVAGQKAVTRLEEQVMRLERVPMAGNMALDAVDFWQESGFQELLSAHDITEETDSLFLLMKANIEEVLRKCGYDTPKTADGTYSTETKGSFSRGVKKGETDHYGQAGPAGETASRTVYGEGIAVLNLEKVPENAAAADLAAAVIDWYREHPEWSFGGLDGIEKTEDGYRIFLYAGILSFSGKRFFTAKTGKDSLEADAVYVGFENPETMRYVYQKYEEDGEFSYELERKYSFGSGSSKRYYVDAIIRPALQDNGAGRLEKIYHTVMVYHKKGEEIIDYMEGIPESGYRVPLTELTEKVEITTEKETVQKDVELPAVYDEKTGTYTVHVETSGTDAWGKPFSDKEKSLTLSFLAVTEQKKVTLTEADIEALGEANVSGFEAGEELGYVRYQMQFGGASVSVIAALGEDADDTYIMPKNLLYRGQNKVSEDGDTKLSPVQVLERPIRQKVKVVKDIETGEERTYENNSYQIHEDAFTSDFGGFLERAAARAMPNFRFRIYLKSNLERLYRNRDGDIVWVDRGGTPVNIGQYRENFPELVQKLYTETGPEYTRLLETITVPMEDGAAGMREIRTYHYEKFFDAIETADRDKWDNTEGLLTSSFKPFAENRLTGEANEINTSEEARENAKRSDAVRQFAIDWYLEEEAARLLKEDGDGGFLAKDGEVRYTDELYDKALYAAILRAEEYLKPFFRYDLNEIYSILWDSAPDGGSDRDMATLAADTAFLEDGDPLYTYGISKALPYGDYVLVEQQPWNPDWGDFANKHYAVDTPKELSVPVSYENGSEGAWKTPEEESAYYQYRAADLPNDLAAKYLIRFNEETAEASVVYGHNSDGDFEVYRYGLDRDQAAGHYEPYGNPAVAEYYHYQSISEDGGLESGVPFLGGETSGENAAGLYWKDNVKTMTGVRTAYDGKFAPMLIPWSMTEPEDEEADSAQNQDGSSSFAGYAYRKFRNRFYSVRLRVEKLDAETGEPILHDGAIFALYAAERDDSPDGDGTVRRYERPTVIMGTRLFLEAMGAENIVPMARDWDSKEAPGATCYGTVPAGTPVCREKECIVFRDEDGLLTGGWEALSTVRDGAMKKEEGDGQTDGLQITGSFLTPEPVGAGVYVLAEIKAPGGYARSLPVAVEVYSDEISYYPDGGTKKAAAALYSLRLKDDASGNKPESAGEAARIFVSDTAVRLQVSKLKTSDVTRKMKISGRVEGTLAELSGKYGLQNLDLAFNSSGAYLGYGWFKGTLEYLESRKDAGEAVELVYNEQQVFSGYGYVTKELETAKDENRYVPGAVMALYEAIELLPSGDSGDFSFEGAEVTRDRNGNVSSIILKEGYAGEKTELVKKEDGTWTYETVYRGDTPVLFYDIGGLKVIEENGDGSLSGYDENGKTMRIGSDTSSIYALKNGIPAFELSGSGFDGLVYDGSAKGFSRVPETITIYHLDGSGRRDALVDGYTGLAYAEENGKKYAWPVTVSRRDDGTVISRDKILTGRPAEVHADTAQAYITGSVRDGELEKRLEPVYDRYGLAEYYLVSGETYQKGEAVYDRDGDFVRYRYDDLLSFYNDAAYRQLKAEEMTEIGNPQDPTDDFPLWHRRGEAFVIPNIWTTGEKAPNDPAEPETTAGQADMLKRVMPGTYMMEELSAPDGYVRAMPVAVTVEETGEVQTASMTDEKIKIEIIKIDAPEDYETEIISMDTPKEGVSVSVEGKGDYTYKPVPGAKLALYRAERVPSSDYETHPDGWYLKKAETAPAVWYTEDPENNRPVKVTARWTTGGTAQYFEGIPAGDYILEELSAPSGYVRASMGITVRETEELQTFLLRNDHTKLEIFKYETDENGKKVPLPAGKTAGLALYPAVVGPDGLPVFEDGEPVYDSSHPMDEWETADVSRYLESCEVPEKGWTGRIAALFRGKSRSGFSLEYEKHFLEYGDGFDTFSWFMEDDKGLTEHSAKLLETDSTAGGETVTQLWEMDQGDAVRITVNRASEDGTPDFEYRFRFRKTESGMISYDTASGIHRIDRIPAGYYVLAETKTPEGYQAVRPKLVQAGETAAVWRYELENVPKELWIDKTDEDGNQIIGAELVLYRAAADGSFSAEAAYEIDRWISGSEGRFTADDAAEGKVPDGYGIGSLRPHKLKGLPYGTYYLAEASAPDYFSLMETKRMEVTADSAAVVKAENRMAEGILELKKKEEGTKIPLSGAEFEVTNLETGETFFLVTDFDGSARSELLPVGSLKDGAVVPYQYRVREVLAPDGYERTSEEWQFSFDGNRQEAVIAYELEAENRKTELLFSKTDFHEGFFVEGAVLAVYEARLENGSFVKQEPPAAVWVSSGGPKAIRGLKAGQTYVLEEITAPEGYGKAEPMPFSVSADGKSLEVLSSEFQMVRLVKEESGEITALTVTGRAGLRTVSSLYKNGTEVCTWHGNGNGRTFAESELSDGELYTLKERAVYSDGSTAPIGSETFRADGAAGGYWLADRRLKETRLTLMEKDGRILDSWSLRPGEVSHTVKNSAEEELAGRIFEAGKSYVLEETTVFQTGDREEAQTTGRLHFWLDENGIRMKVEMNDKATHVEITKADLTDGDELPGAGMILKDSAGRTVDRWVSGEEPHVLRGTLLAGETYTLEETAPPSGYAYAEAVTFTVEADGSIQKVKMSDRPTHVEITKADVTTGEELPGASMVLKDSTGNVVERWISGEKPHVLCGKLLAGETYVLEETAPPSGYAYAEAVTFTVETDGSIQKVEMSDRPTQVEITKTDIADGAELPGAHLVLSDAAGNVIDQWISGDTPHRLTAVLEAGKKYRLTETAPPSGYAYSEEVEFQVSMDGQIDRVFMEDKKTEVYVKKTDGNTGELLPGAVLRLEEENGNLVCEWVTDVMPRLLEGSLDAGKTYLLKEVKAPEGYEKGDDIRFTVPEDGEPLWLDMKNFRLPKKDVPDEDEPEEPPRPKENQPVPRQGTISARYSRGWKGIGEITFGDTPVYRRKIPKTGDDGRTELYEIIMILSAAGLAFLAVQKRKRGERK